MSSSISRTVALIACAGILVGSVGPWATTVFGSTSGTSGDGGITLFSAIAAGGLLLTFNPAHGTRRILVVVVLGVIASLVGIDNLLRVGNSTQTIFGQQFNVTQIGWGLWLTAVASVVLTISAYLLRRQVPQPA